MRSIIWSMVEAAAQRKLRIRMWFVGKRSADREGCKRRRHGLSRTDEDGQLVRARISKRGENVGDGRCDRVSIGIGHEQRNWLGCVLVDNE
jgi:hypothetical protein